MAGNYHVNALYFALLVFFKIILSIPRHPLANVVSVSTDSE